MNFEAALTAFVEGAQKIVTDYRVANFPTLPLPVLTLERGPKNVRVVREDGQRSVFCFVNIATGDVLKAAGWKAPAKHARGNIYDADNGVGRIGPYGPAYLR